MTSARDHARRAGLCGHVHRKGAEVTSSPGTRRHRSSPGPSGPIRESLQVGVSIKSPTNRACRLLSIDPRPSLRIEHIRSCHKSLAYRLDFVLDFDHVLPGRRTHSGKWSIYIPRRGGRFPGNAQARPAESSHLALSRTRNVGMRNEGFGKPARQLGPEAQLECGRDYPTDIRPILFEWLEMLGPTMTTAELSSSRRFPFG